MCSPWAQGKNTTCIQDLKHYQQFDLLLHVLVALPAIRLY
jgi:hypothetical protein